MINQSDTIKDGGIFYRDIAEMHSRARCALLKAKKAEKYRPKVPVRINSRTIILVDAGTDIDRAVFKFKKRHKL
jgi:hypothetical protein